MGTYNVNCSVSNITIVENSKACVLLLVPSREAVLDPRDVPYKYVGVKGSLPMNELSQSVYTPFGFPIYGIYDSNGGLKNIQRDYGVSLVEDFFGMCIEDIIATANDEKRIEDGMKNISVLKVLTCTYISPFVLNGVVNVCGKGSNATWDYKYHLENIESLKGLFYGRLISLDKDIQVGSETWKDFVVGYGIAPTTCKYNFLTLFNVSDGDVEKFCDAIENLAWFIRGMDLLKKMLLPSNNVGDTDNCVWALHLNNIVREGYSKGEFFHFSYVQE